MKKWILLHRKRHRIRRNLRPMVYTTGWSLTQRQLTNFLFQPHKKKPGERWASDFWRYYIRFKWPLFENSNKKPLTRHTRKQESKVCSKQIKKSTDCVLKKIFMADQPDKSSRTTLKDAQRIKQRCGEA